MSNTSSLISSDTKLEAEPDSTFRSIFAPAGALVALKVPDYQRAFSWEEKQAGLFLSDLREYQTSGRSYYFGHFIIENCGDCWEIVDGQQRITTFVLFLLVCRHHHPTPLPDSADCLRERFFTVSYDMEAYRNIAARLGGYLARKIPFDSKHPPDSKTLSEAFGLSGDLTRSQRRIILVLLQMDQAFLKGELDPDKIPAYIDVLMKAHCSHHLTRDKSVAVNVFEMHNTRGVPLTTLEVVKAMLMKFVYDHGETEAARKELVEGIQSEFGQIYGMEERLAECSFRGEMTTDQILRHHLRAVDDGSKAQARQFHSPPADANGDALIAHVGKRLRFEDDDKTPRKPEDGVAYALALARELSSSMRIVSEHLPRWDMDDSLVGDVLILEPGLSCEFFLIVCRRLSTDECKGNGRLPTETMKLWERFLFIRDFHGAYHRLWYKDDFPKLFSELGQSERQISELLQHYLSDGFRDQTKGLQKLVDNYLVENQPNILNSAFHWWKGKMIYGLYKYEVSLNTNLRTVMKGSPSVEHILPQEWQWEWIDGYPKEGELPADERERLMKEVGGYINGLGNLLLLTPGQNTRAGNTHPAEKDYPHDGGSYQEHKENLSKWKSSKNWAHLIDSRGNQILNFIRRKMVAVEATGESPL